MNIRCTSRVMPLGSIRGHACGKPAKWAIKTATNVEGVEWEPACGTHKGVYVRRAYKDASVAQLVEGADGPEAVLFDEGIAVENDIIAQLDRARFVRMKEAEAQAKARRAETEKHETQRIERAWNESRVLWTVTEDVDYKGDPIYEVKPLGDVPFVHGSTVGVTTKEGEPPEVRVLGSLAPQTAAQARAMARAFLAIADDMDAMTRANSR